MARESTQKNEGHWKRHSSCNPTCPMRITTRPLCTAPAKNTNRQFMVILKRCAWLTQKNSDHQARDGTYWAQSAANVFAILKRFSQKCILIPKPDWMLNRSKLIEIAKRALWALPDYYNETRDMLGSALQPSDPLRVANCYNKGAQVSEGEDQPPAVPRGFIPTICSSRSQQLNINKY